MEAVQLFGSSYLHKLAAE